MKKIFVVLMAFLCFRGHSQDCLGLRKDSAVKIVKKVLKPIKTKSGKTPNGQRDYILFQCSDNKEKLLAAQYYFERDTCVMYEKFFSEEAEKSLIDWLNKKYKVADENVWYSDELIIKTSTYGSALVITFVANTVKKDFDKEAISQQKKDTVRQVVTENEKDKIVEDVFLYVSEMPQFPGGEEMLKKYIAKNLKYPEKEKDMGVSGKVYVSFIVETDGSLSNIQIERGIQNGEGLSQEALRVFGNMPKWKAGRNNGTEVRVKIESSILFK